MCVRPAPVAVVDWYQGGFRLEPREWRDGGQRQSLRRGRCGPPPVQSCPDARRALPLGIVPGSWPRGAAHVGREAASCLPAALLLSEPLQSIGDREGLATLNACFYFYSPNHASSSEEKVPPGRGKCLVHLQTRAHAHGPPGFPASPRNGHRQLSVLST